jgi:predicted RNase H-like nuclease
MTMCAGVDGCKGGWIAVWRDAGQAPQTAVFGRFQEILDFLPADTFVTVDMPIGLPEQGTQGGRVAEQAARPLLALRSSSVFSMPSRKAVYAERPPFPRGTYRQARGRALEVARATSTVSKGFPIPSFGIFPKIQEIDTLLRAASVLSDRVFESHPEVAFREMNGKLEMQHGKMVGVGQDERRAILSSYGFPASFLMSRAFSKAKVDDFLDACAMLVVAERIARGEAVSYPSPPGRDSFGLPIAIWA